MGSPDEITSNIIHGKYKTPPQTELDRIEKVSLCNISSLVRFLRKQTFFEVFLNYLHHILLWGQLVLLTQWICYFFLVVEEIWTRTTSSSWLDWQISSSCSRKDKFSNRFVFVGSNMLTGWTSNFWSSSPLSLTSLCMKWMKWLIVWMASNPYNFFFFVVLSENNTKNNETWRWFGGTLRSWIEYTQSYRRETSQNVTKTTRSK